MTSKQPISMISASLIILNYLKENNDFDKFVQLSEKGLPFTDKEIANLINYLETDGLLIKGPSGEYHFDDIHIKGKLCARITIDGEKFIDENNLSFKGLKITEYFGPLSVVIDFFKFILSKLFQIF